MAPKTLSTITVNASTAFPASLLSASASLFNLLVENVVLLLLLLPPPKTLVMATTIVEIVIERAVNIENMVMPC